MAVENGYRRLLGGAMAVRPLILLIGLVVAGGGAALFLGLKSETFTA